MCTAHLKTELGLGFSAEVLPFRLGAEEMGKSQAFQGMRWGTHILCTD